MYEKLPLLGDTEACEYKAKNQSDPNTRQYLAAANEIYQIAEIDKAYFMDVKDVRIFLTHYNPKKKVSDKQKKNSYMVIYRFFVATFAKVVGIKCSTPSMILFPPENDGNKD